MPPRPTPWAASTWWNATRDGGGIGWTRGVLDQAGTLDYLATLPAQLRLQFPGGTTVLGVHASPSADDGPGIDPGLPDEPSAACWPGAVPTGGRRPHPLSDRRMVAGIRALNPGSTGMPRPPARLAAPYRRRPR